LDERGVFTQHYQASALDERGVFTQHYRASALDASVLLMPMMGFLPSDDPRIHASVLAIADELTEDDFVLRYRVEETDNGLSGEEGTFTICSFWLVSALVDIGQLGRARQLCQRLLSNLVTEFAAHHGLPAAAHPIS
jgi:alpha,alpha-trehalase